MALAYRVTDALTGAEVALKQLSVSSTETSDETSAALFEREFHTLAELSHPHIIEVFDYGLDDAGPYYTMELLEGGDLSERSPLPWRDACEIADNVCSSLALIHSRRLVHRDVTPRNIRCTRDGKAKLIDFGAMIPMGQGGISIGTPSFVAPEVVFGSALDARADLFSLGATLYYALTGRAAYSAREFVELPEVWNDKPAAPSRFVDGIPDALDALVLSLLDLDPSMRPRSAFEVMHRLSAIADLERRESHTVSRAYLTTPALVGRADVTKALRTEVTAAFKGRGGSVLLVGAPGVGRSRMLDVCVLEAKLRGATVLRAGARSSSGDPFAVAEALHAQLVQRFPEVATRVPHEEIPTAFVRTLLSVTDDHPVVIAVDDFGRIDESSAGLVAALAAQTDGHRLLIASSDEDVSAVAASARAVLRSSSTCVTLNPLSLADTEELLKSVFGDVPNVALVSRKLQDVSRGNPRTCIELAQHLVDGRRVLYEAGTWTLPSALDESDLPGSEAEAVATRIASLSPLARFIAEAQAMASHTAFTREEYALLRPRAPSRQVDAAISELLSRHVLTHNGLLYTLSDAAVASTSMAALSEADRAERHGALVPIYELRPGLSVVHHQLAAGTSERALGRLGEVLAAAGDASALRRASLLDSAQMVSILDRALDAACSLGRSLREINELRRWIVTLSVTADECFYLRHAPAWLVQLKQDSGLDRWHELAGVTDPTERRNQAIGSAYERYATTPEAERGYRPDEAIRGLVHYVVVSIAVGSRTYDLPVLRLLPSLLEPFVALSPAIEAMWLNALATRESVCDGRSEVGLEISLDLYRRLEAMTSDQLPYLELIRHAVAFGIGAVSAQMGLGSAAKWAELLEQDSLQQVSALYLRKAIRLQAGDWEGAERFRRKAEVLALQSQTRQMFANSLTMELTAHAMAGDLTGVKQVIDRIEPLARRSPGWVPYRHIAEGHFQRIRGNFELARAAYERALALTTPDPGEPFRFVTAFPSCAAGYVETLVGLGLHQEAKDAGEGALAACSKVGIGVQAHVLSRALALTEAKLGDYVGACERLERVMNEQLERGVAGLLLGATYEARARIAVWASDESSVERFARLTAGEYRHGLGSALGARYERLMDEARRFAVLPLPKLTQFDSTRRVGTSASMSARPTERLREVDTSERAARALGLLCEERSASEGHLYLCGAKGLTLVASEGAAAPPGGLREYLEDRLIREVEAFDLATVIHASSSKPAAASALGFTDAQGGVHRPAFLTAVVAGEARYVAIAVTVERNGRPMPTGDGTLASLIAAELIDAHDTEGVAIQR
jgi:serine/threonine-protein kinase